MKTFLLICWTICLTTDFTVAQSLRFLRNNPPPPPPPTEDLARSNQIAESYFTQKLDHFNPDEEKTWMQVCNSDAGNQDYSLCGSWRYYANDQYFNNTANKFAFLMLGGEGDASWFWLLSGSWISSAKKYGALLFLLEHRFYGESHPFSDLGIENLQYLSSEQALADAAEFIKGMNKQYSLGSDVKWIVYGGSYSGSLAAWLRLKYPDLVHGAVSASGPLLAKLDFSEYFQVVIDDLNANNDKCVATLKTAMSQVDDLLNNPNPEETLTSIFNLCEPIEDFDADDANVINFNVHLIDVFAYAAQYNGQLGFTIEDFCNILTDEDGGKEIIRLANVTKVYYGTSCLEYSYASQLDTLKNTEANGFFRQWFYQTCTEFGWFQTTNREDNILGKGCSADFYTVLCVDAFGPEFNKSFINSRIDQTNADYGGTGINVSNVIYVHGSLDPWHAVGLTETTNPDSPVINVEGTSHCQILYDATEGELPQLTEARAEVDRLVGLWLGIN